MIEIKNALRMVRNCNGRFFLGEYKGNSIFNNMKNQVLDCNGKTEKSPIKRRKVKYDQPI